MKIRNCLVYVGDGPRAVPRTKLTGVDWYRERGISGQGGFLWDFYRRSLFVQVDRIAFRSLDPLPQGISLAYWVHVGEICHWSWNKRSCLVFAARSQWTKLITNCENSSVVRGRWIYTLVSWDRDSAMLRIRGRSIILHLK